MGERSQRVIDSSTTAGGFTSCQRTSREPLSVLYVHNRYRQRGGEDAVFEAESNLMESYGHRIERLIFENHTIPSRRSPVASVKLAMETVWSRSAQARLKQAIRQFRPDVVHFHNTLPLVSPAAYRVAKKAGAAVVQTLHNFRLVCPSGLLHRNGAPCEHALARLFPYLVSCTAAIAAPEARPPW